MKGFAAYTFLETHPWILFWLEKNVCLPYMQEANIITVSFNMILENDRSQGQQGGHTPGWLLVPKGQSDLNGTANCK